MRVNKVLTQKYVTTPLKNEKKNFGEKILKKKMGM